MVFVYAVISPPTSFLLLRLMGAIYALLIYDLILRMARRIEFLFEKGEECTYSNTIELQ